MQPATPYDRAGLVYAAVVAGHVGLQQPSGRTRPMTRVQFNLITVTLLRQPPRSMSDGRMSGALCGLPDGTTISAIVATNFALAGERLIKIHIYVSGVVDTRDVLS
jgi:hypothetical protein